MRKTLQTLACAAVALFTSAYAEDTFDNGVLVLTDDTFDEAIAKYDYLLVEFYAPWCGHCKKLVPEYEAAAAVLSEQDPPRTIAKVDATENNAIAERMQIKGFPTLFFWKNDEVLTYDGGRKKEGIIAWVNRYSVSNTKELLCSDIEQTITVPETRNVIFMGPDEHPLHAAVVEASTDASTMKNWSFYLVLDDPDCAAKFGVAYPSLSLFRFFDSELVELQIFDEEQKLLVTGADLPAQLHMLSVPSLIEFSEEYIEHVMHKEKTSLILFTNNVNKDQDKPYFQAFADVAESLFGGDQMLFVTSGVSYGIQIRLGEFVGAREDALPQIYMMTPQPEGKSIKYRYSKGPVVDVTAEDLREFIQQYNEGVLPRFFKSEAVPAAQKADTLNQVVAKNWHEVVLNSEKDVLMLYQTAYCKACKDVHPVLKELAATTSDDFIVGYFDLEHNELDGVSIPAGVPAFRLYPKDNKAGVDYSGDRELADFQSWLSEKSSAYQAARAGSAEPTTEEL